MDKEPAVTVIARALHPEAWDPVQWENINYGDPYPLDRMVYVNSSLEKAAEIISALAEANMVIVIRA